MTDLYRPGTRLLPILRSGSQLKIGIELAVILESGAAQSFHTEPKQIVNDLGLADRVRVDLAGGTRP
jgi:hypothetical protein